MWLRLHHEPAARDDQRGIVKLPTETDITSLFETKSNRQCGPSKILSEAKFSAVDEYLFHFA